MQCWPFGCSSTIGLEIHAQEVRWLQVSSKGGAWRLENFGIVPWSAQGAVEGEPEYWQQLQFALCAASEAGNLSGKPAAIALPRHAVISKRIQVPGHWLKEQILMEVRKHLQTDLMEIFTEMSVDYVCLPGHIGQSLKEILFMATRQEYLTQLLAVLSYAGFNIKIVDVDYYALARAVALHVETGQLSAVLASEGHLSRFLVLQEKYVPYVQQWAAHDFSEWCERAKQVLQVFHTTYPQLKIKHIYLTNQEGCSEIAAWLRETCALTSSVLNIFGSMHLAADFDPDLFTTLAPRLVVCCGLAQRKMPLW